MHFRVRGNSVQVVRTVVDKKTLATKSVPAGSANIQSGQLSEQLLSSLNEKELHEVRRYIEGRQRIDKLRREVDAYLLAERIRETIIWLKEAPSAAASDVVEETLGAIAAFRQTANKLGLMKQPGKPFAQ